MHTAGPMSPTITELELHNFKGVGMPCRLQFQTQVTVLLGPNGCGKSSVLQAAHLLGRLAGELGTKRPRPGREIATDLLGTNAAAGELVGASTGPTRSALSFPAGAAENVRTFGVSAKASDASFSATMEVEDGLPLAPATIACRFFDGATGFGYRSDANNSDPFPPIIASFRSQYLRPEFRALASASHASTGEPNLEETGAGLAVLLNWLASNQRKQIDQIEQHLRAIVPSFEELRIRPVSVRELEQVPLRVAETTSSFTMPREVAGHQLELKFSNVDKWVPAQHASEGTLLALALLAALHGPRRPRLLLIDDLDRALHPSAQAALVKAVRDVLKTTPESQVICTTHSPYLLDCFEEPEVLVINRDALTMTSRRFSEHPDWPRFKSTMRLGEFWASVGDNWVFGGK